MNQNFEIFLRLFPLIRVIVDEMDLRYRFTNPVTAKYFEGMAREIIIANNLPLVFDLEVWEVGGRFKEACLVIEMAPEETIA